MISFKGAQYPKDVILFAVFFYVRYGVSYRDLEEIMAERGVSVDHTTLKATRTELLAQLRALGINEVTAEYEGYGDSGNVEDVTVQPAEVKLSEALATEVGDFAWSLAYHHHPGFENNEGGYGTLTWDIAADSITLDHADRYVECSHSYDEGL